MISLCGIQSSILDRRAHGEVISLVVTNPRITEWLYAGNLSPDSSQIPSAKSTVCKSVTCEILPLDRGHFITDYTKAVLIKNLAYIDSCHPAVVDQDEYKETMQNLERIAQEAYEYISDYKNHINGEKKLHPREVERRYGRSTLPYFEEYLVE